MNQDDVPPEGETATRAGGERTSGQTTSTATATATATTAAITTATVSATATASFFQGQQQGSQEGEEQVIVDHSSKTRRMKRGPQHTIRRPDDGKTTSWTAKARAGNGAPSSSIPMSTSSASFLSTGTVSASTAATSSTGGDYSDDYSNGSSDDMQQDDDNHYYGGSGDGRPYRQRRNGGIMNDDDTFCFGRKETASCLTRELKMLPMQRREEVGQDLYGISQQGGIEMNEQSYIELNIAIDNMKDGKDAYELACEYNPSYVHDVSFRRMFLRATQGDVKRAAKRITKHFTTKLSLFGHDKLVKDIELSDLNEYDMEALKSGGFQVLSHRDLAGRSILFGRYTAMKFRETKNMLRALWYIWMTMLEDEVNQLKGVVALGYEIGRTPLERFDHVMMNEQEDNDTTTTASMPVPVTDGGFDRDLARQIISIPLSVPIRPVGYHLCTDSVQWMGILDMVMATLCKFVRLRMRIHHGTSQECKYALMTHGVPVTSIPVNDDSGDIDLTNHFEWLEQRQIYERSRL